MWKVLQDACLGYTFSRSVLKVLAGILHRVQEDVMRENSLS